MGNLSLRHAFLTALLALAGYGALWLAGVVHPFPAPDPYQDKSLLRNHIPPYFNPLRTDFTCKHEALAVPPIDPEAERWHQEALALESRDIFDKDRDYKRIVELTRAAAERHHWKAMLNLVNLRLEGDAAAYGLPVDHEAAVREVEAAMALGIPAAFDKMGYFYENGIGVPSDISAAYAFYQQAAEMGHPPAMTFLASKMVLGETAQPLPGMYSNKPIAIKMLVCAFAQGYGRAAYQLHVQQIFAGDYSPEVRARALHTLHEGVKMGDKDCAFELAMQFKGSELGTKDNLTPNGIDIPRSERYVVISKMLDWYGPQLKLPHLDRILPLPPAPLPPWDGDEDHLIDAAKGIVPVTPAPKTPKRTGRARIPDGHILVLPPKPQVASHLAERWKVRASEGPTRDGYWQPDLPDEPGMRPEDRRLAREANALPPQFYRRGEAFEPLPQGPALSSLMRGSLYWAYRGEAVPYLDPDPPRVRARLAVARELNPQAPRCPPGEPCPRTGAWIAFLPAARQRPEAPAFNTWWRQAWFTAGQELPDASLWQLEKAGLDVPAEAIEWVWLTA